MSSTSIASGPAVETVLIGRSRRQRLVRWGRDDTGSLTVLIVGFAAVLVLVVAVVVNASKAFLVQRALFAAADGAASAAASAVDEASIYEGGLGDAVPLDEAAVSDTVLTYVGEAGLPSRFAAFEVVEVTSDGETATVTFSALVPMPLVGAGTDEGGYRVEVTASARSPLTPGTAVP